MMSESVGARPGTSMHHDVLALKRFGFRISNFRTYVCIQVCRFLCVGVNCNPGLLQSRDSAMKVARRDNCKLSTSQLAEYASEFTMTTATLIGLVCQIGCSSMQESGNVPLLDGCRLVLKAITSTFIPDTCNMEFIVAHSDDKIVGKLAGRVVSFDVTHGRRFGLANKKSKLFPGLDIVDTLMVLTDSIRRPSKCGFINQAIDAFHTLCNLVQAEVEMSTDSALWDNANALALPPLGALRARRTPLSVKQAGASAAAKTPTITSTGQIIAAQKVLDEAEGGKSVAGGNRRRLGAVVSPKTCGTWMIQNCTQHILQSRADATNAAVFGIVLDGGQIGRKKSIVFLGYNPSTKIGTYGALQDRLAIAISLNLSLDTSPGYVPFTWAPKTHSKNSKSYCLGMGPNVHDLVF